MAKKLADEIGKKQPFVALEEEVALNLLLTADRMMGFVEKTLKASGITPSQYNVLRILRGNAPKALSCQEISRVMITRDADLTRLLDRLVKNKLVARERDETDRRIVLSSITPAGLSVLKSLDLPMSNWNTKLLGPLGKDKLKQFIDLL